MGDLSFSTSVRLATVPPAVIGAIEELQRGMRAAYGGERIADLLKGWGIARDRTGADVSDPGSPLVPVGGAETPDYSIPSPPENLVALAGYSQMFLKVDPILDRRFGYIEWWRAEVDDLSSAALIGTSTANFYADTVNNNTTYFYWARVVSKWTTAANPIHSSFNQTAGTEATSAPDIDYALTVLTGSAPTQPFYYLPTDETIDGVTIPAGTYIKQAYIRDAVVRTFRAGLAVIDSASIIELDAVKITTASLVSKLATIETGDFETIFADKAFIANANIADASIGFAKISDTLQSWNYSAGVSGWRLGKNGYFEVNTIYARGDIQATSLLAATGTFTGTVDAGTFNGGTFNGGTFIANLLRNSGNTVALDLTASGSTPILRIGTASTRWDGQSHYDVEVFADGHAFFNNAIVSRPNVFATGTQSNAAGFIVYEVPSVPNAIGGDGGGF